MDCFDNDLGNNFENNTWNLEHNAEKLKKILNRIMQEVISIITLALVYSQLQAIKQSSWQESGHTHGQHGIAIQVSKYFTRKLQQCKLAIASQVAISYSQISVTDLLCLYICSFLDNIDNIMQKLVLFITSCN